MDKNILFIVLPTRSHYHSMLSIQKHYSMQGYSTFATAKPSDVDYVSSLGYKPVVFDYLNEYRFYNTRTFFKSLLLGMLSPSFSVSSRYRNLVKTGIACRELCELLNPDAILIDAHLSSYVVFFSKVQERIEIVETKLIGKKQIGIPPLYIDIPFYNNIAYKILSEVLWAKHLIRKKVSQILQFIAYKGFSENRLLKIYGEKKGVVNVFAKEHKCSFSYLEVISSYKKIIVSPVEIEYPWRRYTPNELAFPPTCYDHIDQVSIKPPLQQWLDGFITSRNQNKSDKLIYCSFGTMSNSSGHIRKCFDFLFSIVEDEPSWYLLISSRILHCKLQDSNLKSILISDYVPQSYILRFVDLMVCHGGANSIQECMQNNVKMLIIPQDLKFDQPGNAARLAYHGLGVKAKHGTFSESQLKTLMKNALNLNVCQS